MAIQTRTTALQGEYVRLYCRFIQDGILFDPYEAPTVFITDNSYYQESSSSSSSPESTMLSSESSLSSSTEKARLIVNVRDSLGASMGTFTSDLNHTTGTGITFTFDDTLSHEEFPTILTFSSFLPELACGGNVEITTTWKTNTDDIWSKTATWSAIDSYYFLADTSLAVKLVSITIDVCDDLASSVSSESSNNSSLSSSMPPGTIYGPFTAQKEHTGLWYIDWLVPADIDAGRYFDIWKFKWSIDATVHKREIYELIINKADHLINSISPAKAYNTGDVVFGMVNDLANNFIYEAQRIPVYWEQGYHTGDRKSFNFAFGNWNQDPRPIVRVNQKIHLDGWEPNYNGNVYFNRNLDPEDMVYAQYNFRYFSREEMLDFLNMGLYAMNATPPASISYSNLNNAPFEWRFGIILYAAIKATQRLVFGLNFQERALIFAEKPENVQNAINNFKALYADWNTLWIEVKKDVKTLKLPSIAQISIPEYTLPGGRSRWFRYLYK